MFRISTLKKRDFNAYLDAQREIDVYKGIDHPHVIKLHEVIDDAQSDKLHLVLEYAEKGQLMDLNVVTRMFYPNPQLNQNEFTEEQV